MAEDKLAVVTGASTGIGYELARKAVEDGYAVIICADEPAIEDAADKLRRLGGAVEALHVDLALDDGMEKFWSAIEGREIDLFFANAGLALGHAFHEQSLEAISRLIDLNVTQTTILVHRVASAMRRQGHGRILVTGSIGGDVPGPFDAVYDATKAYLDNFCYGVRDELKDTPITITCLMPGPVNTPIFERGGMGDTPIGSSDAKADPVRVARDGYAAMMRGDAGEVPGFTSKVINMLSGIVPNEILAEFHRRGAEPKG